MKVGSYCRGCLEKLIYQAAGTATPDPELRAKAIEAGLAVLESTFSYDRSAPQIATECHRAIRRVTGNHDVYREMKARELKMAERMFREVRRYYGEDLRSYVKIAALGNSIDFFKDPATVAEEMRMPLDFAIDHADQLEQKLESAMNVLYLSDNAGECFFDLPLLNKIAARSQVIYAVKGFPIQNDITLEDLSQAGLTERIGNVITNGSDAVGTDLSSSSKEFRAHFEMADLVFAKGMANYETLSELPGQGRVFHCLMAKCQPIADSLGTSLNSYVLMLR
ncbi:MAG: hypothetical protein A2Y91_02670 [Chloroflexi bacterium RBG_13_54_8]|nr:MAG: hypothetical protein A2Y91_02670 [Chloroflexi bacterium RBG_13_54_8]